MKTNAARLLDKLGIEYELREYPVDPDDLSAEKVARDIGMEGIPVVASATHDTASAVAAAVAHAFAVAYLCHTPAGAFSEREHVLRFCERVGCAIAGIERSPRGRRCRALRRTRRGRAGDPGRRRGTPGRGRRRPAPSSIAAPR